MPYSKIRIAIPNVTGNIVITATAQRSSRIPDGYTEVSWISNDNAATAYIDTGYKPNNNTRLEFRVSDCNSYWFGSSNQPRVATAASLSTGSAQYYLISNSTDGTVNAYFNNRGINDIVLQCGALSRYVIVNGNQTDNTHSSAAFSCTDNLYLFAWSYAATPRYGTAKIYAVKISENGTLIRNYVPCIRDTDSEPGLFDLVTNTFYSNAGSGTLSYGYN